MGKMDHRVQGGTLEQSDYFIICQKRITVNTKAVGVYRERLEAGTEMGHVDRHSRIGTDV